MKSKALIVLFALISVFVVFKRQAWNGNMFASDMQGYYMYLPTVFIFHDLDAMKYQPGVNTRTDSQTTTLREPKDVAKTTFRINKYPIGVAFFELPLFMVAYAWADNVQGFVPDGYSAPFQLAGIFSTILWIVLGLIVLRKFLKLFFGENTTAITLACITLGTNLYCYSVSDYGMAHTYEFFLFSCVLYHTALYYENGKSKHLYMLGLLTGFIFITRNIDIPIVFIISVFWMVNSKNSFLKRVQLFYERWKDVVIAALLFFLVAFIQCGLWKYTTGHWFYYSYKGEGFDFLHPRLWDGLMSYRKGWFVYTPMAIVGLAGLYFLWKNNGKLAPAFIGYFVVTIYIVFSWKFWWYGASFSARAMIESYAPMALPMGYFVESVLRFKKVYLKSIFLSVCTLLIALNIFQTYQYTVGIIHWGRMNRTYYWKVFGKTSINFEEYEQYMMSEKEYWRDLESINK